MMNSTDKVVYVVLLVLCGYVGYLLYHNKSLKEQNAILSSDKTEIEIKAEKRVRESESEADSLTKVIANKQQTIVNNTFIYEQQNKDIGSLSSDATDSLYRLNLRANYRKYGHLIKE